MSSCLHLTTAIFALHLTSALPYTGDTETTIDDSTSEMSIDPPKTADNSIQMTKQETHYPRDSSTSLDGDEYDTPYQLFSESTTVEYSVDDINELAEAAEEPGLSDLTKSDDVPSEISNESTIYSTISDSEPVESSDSQVSPRTEESSQLYELSEGEDPKTNSPSAEDNAPTVGVSESDVHDESVDLVEEENDNRDRRDLLKLNKIDQHNFALHGRNGFHFKSPRRIHKFKYRHCKKIKGRNMCYRRDNNGRSVIRSKLRSGQSLGSSSMGETHPDQRYLMNSTFDRMGVDKNSLKDIQDSILNYKVPAAFNPGKLSDKHGYKKTFSNYETGTKSSFARLRKHQFSDDISSWLSFQKWLKSTLKPQRKRMQIKSRQQNLENNISFLKTNILKKVDMTFETESSTYHTKPTEIPMIFVVPTILPSEMFDLQLSEESLTVPKNHVAKNYHVFKPQEDMNEEMLLTPTSNTSIVQTSKILASIDSNLNNSVDLFIKIPWNVIKQMERTTIAEGQNKSRLMIEIPNTIIKENNATDSKYVPLSQMANYSDSNVPLSQIPNNSDSKIPMSQMTNSSYFKNEHTSHIANNSDYKYVPLSRMANNSDYINEANSSWSIKLDANTDGVLNFTKLSNGKPNRFEINIETQDPVLKNSTVQEAERRKMREFILNMKDFIWNSINNRSYFNHEQKIRYYQTSLEKVLKLLRNKIQEL